MWGRLERRTAPGVAVFRRSCPLARAVPSPPGGRLPGSLLLLGFLLHHVGAGLRRPDRVDGRGAGGELHRPDRAVRAMSPTAADTYTTPSGRSHPPVYHLMAELPRAARDPKTMRRRLAAMSVEHAFWMAGGLRLGARRGDGAGRRRMADGALAHNRYLGRPGSSGAMRSYGAGREHGGPRVGANPARRLPATCAAGRRRAAGDLLLPLGSQRAAGFGLDPHPPRSSRLDSEIPLRCLAWLTGRQPIWRRRWEDEPTAAVFSAPRSATGHQAISRPWCWNCGGATVRVLT